MSRFYPVQHWPALLTAHVGISDPSPAAMERQRMLRGSYGVHFYSGRNGTGKSAWMVYDTLPDLEAGRTVLSTVRLLDYTDPRPCEGWVRAGVQSRTERVDCPICALPRHKPHQQAHPLYVPFSRWEQLLDLGSAGWDSDDDDSICLMDEITGVADSSDSEGLPPVVRNELAQLRRAGVVIRMSGLNFIRANKRMREACSGVTRCESFLSYDVVDEQGRTKIWRPRRVTVARTYDAKSLPLDDIKESHWLEAEQTVKSRAWIAGFPAIHAYDTLAPVDRVGDASDAGLCLCGGSRRRHECDCHDYLTEKARRKAASAQPRSGSTASLAEHPGLAVVQ